MQSRTLLVMVMALPTMLMACAIQPARMDLPSGFEAQTERAEVTGLGGRVFPLPDRAAESSITLALAFASGAGGSLQMSCASFLGSGHRIEFYGDDGTLVLSNPTLDYFRGFALSHARRADDALQAVPVEDVDPFPDARVGPVSQLVRRFIDACERGGTPSPGFAEGYRVQCLIDAAWRAHAGGDWIDVPAAEMPA